MAADVATRNFREVQTHGTAAVRDRELLIVNGRQGLGKTFAVRTLLERSGLESFYIELEAGCDPAIVFKRLCHVVNGVGPRGPAWGVREEVGGYLAEQHRVLVVDDAQHIGTKALSALRVLHDRDDANWALVISGNDLGRYLSADIVSRSAAWIEFAPMRGGTLDTFLDAYHPILANTSKEIRDAIDAELCRGRPREWAKVLKKAIPLTEKKRLDHIDGRLATAIVNVLRPRLVSRQRNASSTVDGTNDRNPGTTTSYAHQWARLLQGEDPTTATPLTELTSTDQPTRGVGRPRPKSRTA